MTIKKVKPYGVLRSQGVRYLLMSPEPVPRDSWQDDKTHRFLVTDIKETTTTGVYPTPFQVITNNFSLAMFDVPEIQVFESQPEIIDVEFEDVTDE